MLPPHVFQTQFQALWFSLKATFHHPPLLPQTQRSSKKFFRCHGCYQTANWLFAITIDQSLEETFPAEK
jgi:hypothetical protein